MHCSLKDLVGFPASCEGGRCVFWRDDVAPEGGSPAPGCVLQEFELTGTVADRLTRWLLEYKFKADRAHIAAAGEAHSMHTMSRSALHSRGERHGVYADQKSPSCPGCRSLAV